MTTEPTVQQLFDLTGATALVTGAAGYLGGAFSRALAEAGARVVATSRDLRRAKSVADALPQSESSTGKTTHLAVELDHMDESRLEKGFRQALEQAGAIDILVNNGHEGVGRDWSEVTGEQFNRQLANCSGYFLLARLLRDHAAGRQAPASIIMLGSMYGVVGSYPDAYQDICTASPAAYHALKGGIIHLTRHLAVYWAPDNVRVNCLSPGPFPSQQAPAEMVTRLEKKSPLGRMGRPEELKGAVVFLASNASSYVTGQNLIIDGGWTAW